LSGAIPDPKSNERVCEFLKIIEQRSDSEMEERLKHFKPYSEGMKQVEKNLRKRMPECTDEEIKNSAQREIENEFARLQKFILSLDAIESAILKLKEICHEIPEYSFPRIRDIKKACETILGKK
jgi:hypothetical protein